MNIVKHEPGHEVRCLFILSIVLSRLIISPQVLNWYAKALKLYFNNSRDTIDSSVAFGSAVTVNSKPVSVLWRHTCILF
jgi:hypothetical protein